MKYHYRINISRQRAARGIVPVMLLAFWASLAPPVSAASTTIWSSAAAPGLSDAGPDSAVELGVKFRSDAAGTVTGIRFYKAAANTGTHVGNLWSSNGTLLASATFSNETASGWQQVTFTAPVNITSNTVYIASYHVTAGHYSEDDNYFTTAGVDNPPLHALANGVSGPNSVYAYGTSSAFPNQTWQSANYWVDLVFQTGAPPTLSSIAVTPASPSIVSGATQQFTATGTYSDNSTQNLTTQVTWVSSNTLVATITSGGLATGVSAGTAAIAAKLSNITGSSTLTVKAPPTLTSIAVTPTNPTNSVGATQQFTATGTYSDSSTSNITTLVTWVSSNTPVATISSGGLATSVASGSSPISATLSGVTGSTTLTVKAPTALTSIAVTPSNPTNSIGGTQQFTATGTYSDSSTQNLTSQVTWASSNTVVATITAGGLATANASGTATISATLSGVTGTAALTVKAPPSLTSLAVTPVNPTNSVGATQQFIATGTYSDGTASNVTTRVTWSSSAASVATITSGGLATSLSPGSSTISATLTGITNSTVLGVKALPIAISTTSLPAGISNTAYSASLTATGGTTPYTWSIIGGALPAGLVLNSSSGAITGTPTAVGTFNITFQVSDSGTPAQSTNKALSITITAPSSAIISIWPSATVPGLADGGPDSSVELGVKFQADVAGNVVGIRFYKATANTGTHVGNLWSSAGTLLASATFSNETASGWQQVNFAIPVSLASNTIYVASYHANAGHYSADINYFSGKGADNPPLHALTNGVSGGNGVYAYGTSSAFPNQTWNAANYYVDMAFQRGAPATLTSIAVTPANPSILNGATQQFTATGTYSDNSTQNLTSQVTWSSSNTVVATISAGGLATGVSAGTAPVWAALSGIRGTTTLSVTAAPTLTAITVAPVNPTNLVGATQQFTATGAYSDSSTQNLTLQVTWSSSNTVVATISANGLATSVSAGAAPIWASLSGVSGSTLLTVKAPPTLTSIAVTPANPSIVIGGTQQFAATGTYSDNSTQNLTSQVTWGSSKTSVATVSSGGLASSVSAGNTTISAALSGVTGTTLLTIQPVSLAITTTSLPNGALNGPYNSTVTATGGTTPYSWSLSSGSLPPGLTLAASSGVISGTPTNIGTFNFTVQASDSSSPAQTATQALSIAISPASSAPILVVTNSADPFSQFYAEVLSAEGLNEYNQTNVSSLTSAALSPYDVVVLGQTPLTAAQVVTLSNWVTGGGKLIAMRPDKQLAGLLGVTDAAATLSEGYIAVNTAFGPGAGIVSDTMQFHGTADRYSPGSASSIATLYSTAQAATANPAVTVRNVGLNGGQAAAFTYDLARSIVFTRQGNPAWSGQERDAQLPIRSDDLFFGNASFDPHPDWIDFNKIVIPQADEQQHLFANMILYMEASKLLLPRFWFFPQGLSAVVVMTGDDHANGGTAGRFDQYTALTPANASVADWKAVRGTSYMYANTPMTDAQAKAYNAAGFEMGVHLNTGCGDYTRSSLSNFFSQQLAQFKAAFPSLPAQSTHRIHCIAWSDYTTAAEVSLQFGIRLDVSYYYWPSNWILNRPGLFTGSGIPMRFSRTNGVVIDVYQAPTQMTDESGESYPYIVNSLLDKALGPEGYYGAFVANMHTDSASSPGSDAIVSSALSRGVPVITSLQLLRWLDARNGSSIRSVSWANNKETFTVQANAGARGLQAMAPVPGGYSPTGVKFNGSPIAYVPKVIKGIQYAFFPATNGTYELTVVPDTTAPVIGSVVPPAGAGGVNPKTNVTVVFSKVMNASTMTTNRLFLQDPLGNRIPATVSFVPGGVTAVITPNGPLALSTTYMATVKGGAGGVFDAAGNPLASDAQWAFTTTNQIVCSIWSGTASPTTPDAGSDTSVELGVRFQSDTAGKITSIRFYKSSANTGTHVGSLWSSSGSLLASATFSNEGASGWQQVDFTTPVSIAANTVYVASYHVNNGHYAADPNYFANGVDNPPLHALSSSSGGNGVYRYGSSSIFPNSNAAGANYWIDVVLKAP